MSDQAEHAGMWLRVSSSGQDEQSQGPANAAWITAHGYDLARTYTVHGRSAYKGNKAFDEEWAKVLEDMRTGVISVLVVWKQDRIDRKLQTFQMLAQVVEAGGRVEFVTQTHLNDLTSMGGRISLKVQEEIAYAESKDKSDRVKIKQAALRSKGSVVGRAPWGFTIELVGLVKKFVPTDEAKRLIPEVFSRCIAGESFDSIAKWLTAETGHTFWPDVVGKILKSQAYCGRQTDAQGRVIHECESVISASVWQAAQDAIANRPKRGPVNPANFAMLKSVIKCPRCSDSPMYRIKAGNGNTHLYYRCSGKGPVRRGCGVMVQQDVTDAIVSDFLATLDNEVYRTEIIPGCDYSDELAEIAQDLRNLPAQGLDDEAEDARRAQLRSERKRLESMGPRPARSVLVATGATFGAEWSALPAEDRSGWLTARGVGITAARTDAGIAESAYQAGPPARGTAKTLLSRDGVSVVITWPTDLSTWSMYSAAWEREQTAA